MLRPELVRRKLQLIAEDLGQLAAFRNASYEEITGDFVRLAAVERMLERVVMRVIDVNEHLLSELATGEEGQITRLSYRDTFLRLAHLGVYDGAFAERIAKSAGLRNVLVHDYEDVDRRLVYGAIRARLQDYRQYAEHVDAFLSRGPLPDPRSPRE